ncbi:MAG: fumarylacetoacetate hydrolase family protein [Flavobacteriaceae bacterium]
MKLLRYGEKGGERHGILDADGAIRDLEDALPADARIPHLEALEALRAIDPGSLPKVGGEVRIGAPLAHPGKIIACGLNYVDHVAESGLDAGPEPTFFIKPTSSLSGPNDPVVIPPGAEQVDWEVEFGAVVGRDGVYMDEAEAEAVIAGYVLFNDVSERHNQFHRGAGQWVKGKAADTFGPIGPYLVTPDEIEPTKLDIWLELNGKRMQSSNTDQMIFSVPAIIAYASQFMSLQPGDIVVTGTPAGCGIGQKPPFYLKPGDRMRLGIDGLGEQNCEVIAYPGKG